MAATSLFRELNKRDTIAHNIAILINVHILLWTYKAKIKCWLLYDFWLACVTLTCHDMSFYGQDIVLKWFDITMKYQDMKF